MKSATRGFCFTSASLPTHVGHWQCETLPYRSCVAVYELSHLSWHDAHLCCVTQNIVWHYVMEFDNHGCIFRGRYNDSISKCICEAETQVSLKSLNHLCPGRHARESRPGSHSASHHIQTLNPAGHGIVWDGVHNKELTRLVEAFWEASKTVATCSQGAVALLDARVPNANSGNGLGSLVKGHKVRPASALKQDYLKRYHSRLQVVMISGQWASSRVGCPDRLPEV